MISTGVALASHGEMRFNLIGFLIQAAAVAVSPTFLPRFTSIATLRTLLRLGTIYV